MPKRKDSKDIIKIILEWEKLMLSLGATNRTGYIEGRRDATKTLMRKLRHNA